MRIQWNLLLALMFALIIAIFAVVNVESVKVQYVFGTTELPLIIVIIGSALAGGIFVGSVGLFRLFLLGRQLKASQKENFTLNKRVEELEGMLTSNQDKEHEKINEEIGLNKENLSEETTTNKEI
ncbi:LapA family protein [Bacillus sp. Marseille-P3661]|uniref:LapA family protein n=1 Tax=Bacillus sp. Marseille-P3661 TaxID=1936234 RepID=UPI000C81D6B9|nr:lipopolysaccharide assembly protein LapA domain-containing protein [Bacillus sp. Marseille-P3661]